MSKKNSDVKVKSELGAPKIRKSPVLKAKSLYERKTICNKALKTKSKVTLEDVVANKQEGEERLKRNTFFRFVVAEEKAAEETTHLCRSCKSPELLHDERAGEIVCSRCGLVQSERAVVGTFSDVNRVLMPSAVIGDMLHVNYSYGTSIKNAIAAHPLSMHWSEALTEKFAHLILKCINNVWHIVVQREVHGSIPFLITHGAQFAQENHTMPAAATVVNILLQYKLKNVLIDHLYTKFLVNQLDNFKEQDDVMDVKKEPLADKS